MFTSNLNSRLANTFFLKMWKLKTRRLKAPLEPWPFSALVCRVDWWLHYFTPLYTAAAGPVHLSANMSLETNTFITQTNKKYLSPPINFPTIRKAVLYPVCSSSIGGSCHLVPVGMDFTVSTVIGVYRLQTDSSI